MTGDRFTPPPAPTGDPLRQRLEELLDAHCDGALDGPQAEELQAMLADPARRRDLHRYAVLHGGLREAFSGSTSGGARTAPPPPRAGWWRRASLVAAGIGGLLIIGTAIANRTPAAPAVVIRSMGDGSLLVHHERIVAQEPGMRLWPGDHLLGPAQLAWEDGTTLSAEAGSALALESGPGIALHLIEGAVRMEVRTQPADRPLAMRTEQGTATVVGTAFTMAVTRGHALLAVEHGAIDFRSADGSPARRVTAGMQMATNGHGAPGPMPPGAHLGSPIHVVLDPVAERGAGWRGAPVADGVRAVRSGENGWASGTRPGAGMAGLVAAGRSLRVRATCTVARTAEVGVLVVIHDARTGAFLCNRQAIRMVPAGVPTVLEVGWNDLAYVTGPAAGPDAALQDQAVSQVVAFAWGPDPGLVLQRVDLFSGGR